MSKNQLVTRFAPSPTGYLHIGGARTALYNWLLARGAGGRFILRIEDTDKERSTEAAVKAILDGLRWLGMDWDAGPFRQSERGEIYRQKLREMLASGTAYRCQCSAEAVEAMRKKAMAEGRNPKYDGTCRRTPPPDDGRPCVIRLKAPQSGQTVVHDQIKGDVVFNNEELDDLILARSDGSPTYNFTVVVDDLEMGVSHVVRGDDHLINTPKQIQIYRALGGKEPLFAHLPLILGQDKKRLSKRHGATSVLAYRDLGYLPQAVVNFLARIGWSSGDQEIFTGEELIRLFSLKGVGGSSGVFNQEKLDWLNQQYMRQMGPSALAAEIERWLSEIAAAGETEETRAFGADFSALFPLPATRRDGFLKLIELLSIRAKTVREICQQAEFFLRPQVQMDEKEAAKFLTPPIATPLRELAQGLRAMSHFEPAALEGLFKQIIERHQLKMLHLAQPVRLALTGRTFSPGIFEMIELLGKEITLARLEAAIAAIEK